MLTVNNKRDNICKTPREGLKNSRCYEYFHKRTLNKCAVFYLHKSLCEYSFEWRQLKLKLLRMKTSLTKQGANEDSKLLPQVNKLNQMSSQILLIITHDNNSCHLMFSHIYFSSCLSALYKKTVSF